MKRIILVISSLKRYLHDNAIEGMCVRVCSHDHQLINIEGLFICCCYWSVGLFAAFSESVLDGLLRCLFKIASLDVFVDTDKCLFECIVTR